MAQTLEEIIKNNDGADVKNSVKNIAEYFKASENGQLDALVKVQENIVSCLNDLCNKMNEQTQVLEKILNRPDPSFDFPEPPEYQKVTMDAPEWYVPPVPESQDWVMNLVNSLRAEGDKTRKLLQAILEKENIEIMSEPVKEELKTVNTAAVRSRRTTQWKVATYPQVTGTSAIVSAGDNHTYYLPSAVIPNSETVRLNNGIPSSHGADYTLSGNKLVFVQDQTGSTMEVRFQVK